MQSSHLAEAKGFLVLEAYQVRKKNSFNDSAKKTKSLQQISENTPSLWKTFTRLRTDLHTTYTNQLESIAMAAILAVFQASFTSNKNKY